AQVGRRLIVLETRSQKRAVGVQRVPHDAPNLRFVLHDQHGERIRHHERIMHRPPAARVGFYALFMSPAAFFCAAFTSNGLRSNRRVTSRMLLFPVTVPPSIGKLAGFLSSGFVGAVIGRFARRSADAGEPMTGTRAESSLMTARATDQVPMSAAVLRRMRTGR